MKEITLKVAHPFFKLHADWLREHGIGWVKDYANLGMKDRPDIIATFYNEEDAIAFRLKFGV